jgi:hypothetical protein
MSKQPIKITPQTQEFINQLNALKIGDYMDWKFGLITREIYRCSNDRFQLNDMCGEWLTVIINKNTMLKLLTGEKSLNSLNWK